MNEDKPICRLLDLQEKLTLRRLRREERERMPPQVADIDRDFGEKRSVLDALRERTESTGGELRALETKLLDANERLKKFQAACATVVTPKEYSAALNQIDGAKKEIRECEERGTALRGKLAADEEELGGRDAVFPEETADFEKRIADWRAFQERCDLEIERLGEEIAALEAGIPKGLLSQFRQILDRRAGIAVVRVTGPSCGGCNVRLRPALYQKIRLESQKKLVDCETCHRILVCDDELSAGSTP